MCQFVCQGQRIVEVCPRLLGVPKEPEGYSSMGAAGDHPILAQAQYGGMALVWRRGGDGCLQVQTGSTQGAKVE